MSDDWGNPAPTNAIDPGFDGWGNPEPSPPNNLKSDRITDPNSLDWGAPGPPPEPVSDQRDSKPAPAKSTSDWGDWGDSKPTPAKPASGRGYSKHAPAKSKSDWGDWGDSKPTPAKPASGWGDSKPASSNPTSGWGDSKPASSNPASGWGDPEPESKPNSFKRGENNYKRGENSFRRGDDNYKTGENSEKGEDGDKAERPAPYKPEDLNLEEEAKLQGEGAGENFERYKDQKVCCFPKLVTPIESFSEVLESELLKKNVRNLGYSEMTPIQKWAIPAIMGKYDLIGCAQTGSGKTAAFLLPVLQTILKTDLESHDPNSDCQSPYCLIISPTRELARQIYTHAEMLSRDSIIKCRVIYGQVATAHLKYQLSTGCHVLVATPGRLKDFVNRGWINFSNIKYVILDEGDRLVDEGFTQDIRGFFDHPTMPPKEQRQTIFFSATFKAETQVHAKEYLKEEFLFLTVGRVGAANEDIKQEFLRVSRQEKKRELKKILSTIPETDKTIIFTQTKHAADMLASFFSALNLSSTSIHGDRHQSQREQAITSFRRGEKRFLISSPVGNRGLDLPKVALVVNYDLPDNIDEYVHRIGRTGRAGHTGRALSFYEDERDRELLPQLVQILEDAKQEVPDWMKEQIGGQGQSVESTSDLNSDWGWDPSSAKRPADTPAGNSPKRQNNELPSNTLDEEW